MPIKGVVLIFIVALVAVVVCWDEMSQDIIKWFKEDK